MFQTVVRDTVDKTVDIASETVIKPVLKEATNIAGFTASSLVDTFIPEKYRNTAYIISIILSIIFFFCSFFLIYKQFTSVFNPYR